MRERENKFPGMKLEESSLYTRLRLDAARSMHEGIKEQVKNLQGASRVRLSQAQFKLSGVLHDLDKYDLDEVEL